MPWVEIDCDERYPDWDARPVDPLKRRNSYYRRSMDGEFFRWHAWVSEETLQRWRDVTSAYLAIQVEMCQLDKEVK